MRFANVPLRLIWILTIVLVGSNGTPAQAQDWLGARSQHYRLLGTADDDELQEVGARLEAFYAAINSLFSGQQFRRPAPTTVIVLDDDDDVAALGIAPEADGYFRAGRNENFIILSPQSRSRNPFGPILHDYFHAIAAENLPDLPVWIREGLAEFYSTIQLDDELLMIGNHIEGHVRLTRDDDDRLPYRELFETNHDSAILNELDRDRMFYAQSWALIHFLMMRNRGPGLAQTAVFVHSTAAGLPFEEAFQTAFGTSFEGLREEFEDYVDDRSFPFLRMTVEGIGEDYVSIDTDPFPPGLGETYLADLLLEEGRYEEAERRLEAAIASDGALAAPHTSLGGLRVRQERYAEALDILGQAIEGAGPNYLSHYYYALSFSRVNPELTDEQRTLVREQLQKSIRLRPTFPDAHHELATTYVDAGDDLNEAARLLDQALTLSPDHPAYLITLSRVLIAQDAVDAARSVLGRVLELTEDPAIRERAESLLESISG
jgi:tetratricopeptide (TPR) repeat protein